MNKAESRFWLRFVTGLAMLVFASTPLVFGQATTGIITGTVQDSTGAVMAEIPVTLSGTNTGSVQVNTSDSTGNFRFLQVPPGVYSVEVSVQGFKTYRRDGLIVEAWEVADTASLLRQVEDGSPAEA